ncbi:hypothetical protein [Chryseobacterium sp.]|uniref:hypothetical protein n=1 Tax=Chryseobacterium sp. TaxID=1871047 RepID=UPI002899D745|nr:hypothetical protein [Chryseobacterium sp.]
MQTYSQMEKADFDCFYAQHSAVVFGFILQWIDDKEAAEQIFILTFCKMWKARHTLFDDKKMKTLFYIPFVIQASRDFYEKR